MAYFGVCPDWLFSQGYAPFDRLRMSGIALTPGPSPRGRGEIFGYEFRLEMGHPGCQWATVSDGAAIHLKREIAGRRLDFIIRFPGLDTMVQAVNEAAGEAGLSHLFLGGGPVVLDAVALQGTGPVFVFTAKEGVAGPGVIVPGLADAAGIGDEPPFIQGKNLVLGELYEFEAVPVFRAEKGQVGVAHQAIGGSQSPQGGTAASSLSRYSRSGARRLP